MQLKYLIDGGGILIGKYRKVKVKEYVFNTKNLPISCKFYSFIWLNAIWTGTFCILSWIGMVLHLHFYTSCWNYFHHEVKFLELF